MARPRPITIAAISVLAVLLSGCERWSSGPPTFSGLETCGPHFPGWYVYPPHKYCYPACPARGRSRRSTECERGLLFELTHINANRARLCSLEYSEINCTASSFAPGSI